MKQKNLNLVLLAVGLVVLGVFSRLTAHAWNFTILGGLSIFTGAFFARKWVPVAIVFSTLFISDAVIGFHNQMPAVYLSFALMILAGALLASRPSRLKYVTAAGVGSVLFFTVSNFFVWFEGSLYPRTLNGLVECYVMATPFYHNQLLADIVSSAALFELARTMKKFVATRFELSEVNFL